MVLHPRSRLTKACLGFLHYRRNRKYKEGRRGINTLPKLWEELSVFKAEFKGLLSPPSVRSWRSYTWLFFIKTWRMLWEKHSHGNIWDSLEMETTGVSSSHQGSTLSLEPFSHFFSFWGKKLCPWFWKYKETDFLYCFHSFISPKRIS